MLDAIPITLQPYNSANTLANSVGIAIWNGTLFQKSGNIWKYSSNGSNYNPCPSGQTADYSNLRCIRNYTYDSGWIKDSNNYTHNRIGDDVSYNTWRWQGALIQVSIGTTQTTYNGYTLYAQSPCISFCDIRGIQNRTEYKAFSSF